VLTMPHSSGSTYARTAARRASAAAAADSTAGSARGSPAAAAVPDAAAALLPAAAWVACGAWYDDTASDANLQQQQSQPLRWQNLVRAARA
jgi:hypothetical protein